MNFEVRQGDAVAEMAKLDTSSIDLTVTSPPYDNLREYQGYTFDFENTAKELFRVTKKGGVVVWVVGDATIDGSETGTSFRQALYFKDVCGFNLHDTMIYEKPHLAFPDSNRYYQCFEYMFVLSKGQPRTFNPIKDKPNVSAGRAVSGKDRNRDGSFKERTGLGNLCPQDSTRFNVWRIANPDREFTGLHPAIFPEQLALDHILSWSNEGDTVLDPMCGSGTTGKMAVIARRNFIGIDISADYCAIAEARIKRAQGIPCDIPRPIRPERELPLFATA